MKIPLPFLTQFILLQRACLLVYFFYARACVQFEWRLPVFCLCTNELCPAVESDIWVACVHIFAASQRVFIFGARFQRPALLERQQDHSDDRLWKPDTISADSE